MDGVVDIRGKSYNTVAKRVNDFRRLFKIADGWGIRTFMIDGPDPVVFRAEVHDPEGRVVATGYAEEKRTGKGINATSALENCESSAIGRALAACGFGGESYASADEVRRAIAQQEAAARESEATTWSDNERAAFCAKLGEMGIRYDDLKAYALELGMKKPSSDTTRRRQLMLERLDTETGRAKFDAWLGAR